jgi:Putative Ig domain
MAQRVNQFVFEIGILESPPILVNQFVLEVALLDVPPSLNCGNPPPGQTNIAYSHTFPVTGGLAPFTFSILAGTLPPGLTLDPTTGIVSGTPTTGGTYIFTIQVVDANLNGSSVQCSILIIGGIKITIRGVKRVRCTPEDDFPSTLEDAPKLPSVDRAV